jgi:GT2 family glycosyltransferase
MSDNGIRNPLLSVIIVSYNTREMTLECLRTLYAQLGATTAEVFVIDNASKDGSVEAIHKHFPVVRVIALPENRGFGAANNIAIREAVGDYLLLLNSDAFLKAGALATLIAYLDSHPGAAVVGPRLQNADGSLQLSCYRFPSPFRAVCENLLLTAAFPGNLLVGDYRSWPHDTERAVDFIIGACWLMRSEAVKAVGLFDEEFFLYAEETDWARRFHDAGWQITFLPQAEAIHLGGGSAGNQSAKVFSEFRRGQERYIRKHHGGFGLWVFRASVITGAVLRIVFFSLLALFQRSRREKAIKVVRLWTRIMAWTVGFRGPGLQGR